MIALTTGMITVSCVESIDFDPSGLTQAVAALGRDARRLAESTGDADRVWGGFPEAFWMPGAAEPLYRSVTPAHQAALDLEASSRTLASVVDAASYGIERLQARRGSLIGSIHSLHAIAPLQIDEFALAQPTAGSGPLGCVQWSDVPALRATDGDLRAEAASIAAGWLDAQTELAAQITRIRGGECSELALPPLGNPSVRLASAIAPTFPGGGVGTLGPDIGGFFNGLWTSLSGAGAGVAAGAGTAATFTAAIGELALILSLGGDTDPTRRGPPGL